MRYALFENSHPVYVGFIGSLTKTITVLLDFQKGQGLFSKLFYQAPVKTSSFLADTM